MEADQAKAVEVEPSEAELVEKIHQNLYPDTAKPRDEKGRFTKSEQEAEQPQEAPAEQPEEPAQENAQEEGADAQEQEEVTWEKAREFRIKVPLKNGADEREEELSLEDLRLGYMRQDDYQRKTQEVAQQRNQAQQAVQQQLTQLRQQALQELQVYEDAMLQAIAPQLQGVDWNRLSQEDPAQWAHLRQMRDNVSQAMQAIRYQRYQIEQQQQAESQQQLAQVLQQAQESLTRDLPGWGPEMQKSLVSSAKAYGFADQELAAVSDPRMIKVLHDAHKWLELQSQKPEVTKKVAQVPKVLKPGTKPNPGADRAKVEGELKERVRKSGGKDEAALHAWIHQRMFGR